MQAKQISKQSQVLNFFDKPSRTLPLIIIIRVSCFRETHDVFGCNAAITLWCTMVHNVLCHFVHHTSFYEFTMMTRPPGNTSDFFPKSTYRNDRDGFFLSNQYYFHAERLIKQCRWVNIYICFLKIECIFVSGNEKTDRSCSAISLGKFYTRIHLAAIY